MFMLLFLCHCSHNCFTCVYFIRHKLGGGSGESILVSQLQHGLTLEFEHSDSPRRLRLVLSELLAIMNKVHLFYSQIKICMIWCLHVRDRNRLGSPGGPVVKSLPSSAGGVWFQVRELRSQMPGATKPVYCNCAWCSQKKKRKGRSRQEAASSWTHILFVNQVSSFQRLEQILNASFWRLFYNYCFLSFLPALHSLSLFFFLVCMESIRWFLNRYIAQDL